jgi:preprotein translocase subunit YajC
MSILSLIGISDALADTTAATQSAGQGLLSFLPMLVLLVLFMYFMVIRPQTKRAKEHKNLMSGLQKGDEVVTVGGLLGKIEKVADNFVQLNIAENVTITVQKSAIGTCVPKGTIKSI